MAGSVGVPVRRHAKVDSRDIPGPSEPAAPDPHLLTRLLNEAGAGDADLVGRIFPLAYAELRRIAQHELRREQAGHTLDATALVHEAWLKLAGQGNVHADSRGHFLAIAARAMRTILIDHARARAAAKRGGGHVAITLDRVAELIPDQDDEHLLALDDALTRLAEVNEEAARVVECRYFAGMNLDEIAAVLQTSVATTRRRWAFARAWLQHDLQPGDAR